jgi:hypothetical protein
MKTGDRASDPLAQTCDFLPRRLDEPAHERLEGIDLPAFSDRAPARLS